MKQDPPQQQRQVTPFTEITTSSMDHPRRKRSREPQPECQVGMPSESGPPIEDTSLLAESRPRKVALDPTFPSSLSNPLFSLLILAGSVGEGHGSDP